MILEYLLFDSTDEEDGACSFDAMASVMPDRLAPLLSEVLHVLQWSHRQFGPPSLQASDGEWDYELQAFDEHDRALEIRYDRSRGRVDVAAAPGRVTIAVTLSGSAAFGAAFREAFPSGD